MERTFYGAVSFAELSDFRQGGCLRSVPGSCEGKHLACILQDAREWGEALFGPGAYVVLRITASDAVVVKWAHWARLDGIGPAYFATIDQLEGATVDEVVDES